jgi:hypothetical protein
VFVSEGVEYEDLEELAQLVLMANGATASVDGKDILWCSQGQALRLPLGKEPVAGSLLLVGSFLDAFDARRFSLSAPSRLTTSLPHSAERRTVNLRPPLSSTTSSAASSTPSTTSAATLPPAPPSSPTRTTDSRKASRDPLSYRMESGGSCPRLAC